MDNSKKESLLSRFSKYSRYGESLKKAIDVALAGGVKKHIFMPSGRYLYTVVGREGDEFIDPERKVCSCNHYFFRILKGESKLDLCYHLLSYMIAYEEETIDAVVFSDDEYRGFIRAIVTDLLSR